MRFLSFITLTISLSLLTACGGKSSGPEDNRSSYEKLQGMEAELQAELDKVMAPVDQVDAMITRFTEFPKKLALKAEDFKALMSSIMGGGELKVPGGLDKKSTDEVKAFANDFKTFKESLMNTPNNIASLGIKLGEVLITVPVLAGKVTAESAVTAANPFASKADKKKAKQQSDGVKGIADNMIKKIKEIQTKVTSLPGKATSAIGKFTSALTAAGIDSMNSAKGAAKSAGK